MMKILLLTMMMIFATSVSAGLYKWTDAEGNVHYTQKPPPNQQFKRLKGPAPTPESAKPLYKSTKLKATAEDLIAVQRAKIKKIRDKNCATSRKNLENYQVYRRFRSKDGIVNDISDEERSREVEKARKGISEFCD